MVLHAGGISFANKNHVCNFIKDQGLNRRGNMGEVSVGSLFQRKRGSSGNRNMI